MNRLTALVPLASAGAYAGRHSGTADQQAHDADGDREPDGGPRHPAERSAPQQVEHRAR